MKPSAYKQAGVDIELANKVKSGLPALLASTRRRGVVGEVGGFGGLFALDTKKYKEPVLVASVDGVGTKLKIAFALDRHDTIGQDLVNHCVNDIAVLGAEPLFFLDYIGTATLEPRVFREIIQGFSIACAQNKCALIGGETAQMPGFYQPGEYDVSGTIVGVVERSRILDGKKFVRPGDAVIGFASNGLHTNGYSLARKVFLEQMGLRLDQHVPELGGTLGEELLKIHLSYGSLIKALLRRFNSARTGEARPPIRAFAHITGGGFIDNIPRVLPRNCDVCIRKNSWAIPPVFQLIARWGQIEEPELYQVFNMGIGMVAIVANDQADDVCRFAIQKGSTAWLIGEVVKGSGRVRIV
ncbi:MAG: phosphoribosylformylglycinamidine cyclo-ligase [Verrucomicrobiae bacterium]|nr:phosphoribosylformylglycinamidine cyclo-ligase [Verrucomicrobiae bacterium]